MKVFISWSGEPTRTIARALTGWLQTVVQHVDVWMSDEEIGSGARWNDEIAKSLSETNFGIVCVTRENQDSAWLTFEAGALAKSVEVARVVPLCVGLSPAEVTGPLAAFQGRQLDENGVRRLVQDINAATEKPIPADQLNRLFDAMWPGLDTAITQAIAAAPGSKEPRRAPEDMLAELVETTRRIERHLDGGSSPSELQRVLIVEAKGSRGKSALPWDLLSRHSTGAEPDALWLLRPSEAEEGNQPNSPSESED